VKNKVVALMPMKGHSERVPNKNLRMLCGKPLYQWVVDALLETKEISKILIDTDSQEIIEDIKKAYVTPRVIAFRRQEFLLGDFVSMNAIINYDISLCDEKFFMQTHATNPLLTSKTIKEAIQLFFDNQKQNDSVFAVNKIQSRLYDKNCNPINHNPKEMLRTQDLDPIYEENSNFYIFSKESFFKAQERRIGLKPLLFGMSELESVDIDFEDDFILAECIIKATRHEK